jgi:hypothetical protein
VSVACVTTRTATVAFLFVLAGCSGGGGGGSRNDVAFTRADGSSAQFPAEVRAWCGEFDEDNVDVEGVHLLAADGARGESPGPYWIVDAVRADIEGDPSTSLPNSFTYTEPRDTALFVFDKQDRGNELSSADEESSGTITVDAEGCDAGESVTVEFDDIELGSEYHDLPPLSVSGKVVAEIGEPPF